MNDLNGEIIGQFLRDEGGNDNAILNYSDADLGITPFFIQATNSDTFVIHRMVIHFEASVQTSIVSSVYGGGNNNALANGIDAQIVDRDDTLIIDLTDSFNVKTNAGWGRYNFNAEPLDYSIGDAQFTSRWSFSQHGRPIVLRNNAKFQLVLNDDFSGLDMLFHTFYVGGYKLTR